MARAKKKKSRKKTSRKRARGGGLRRKIVGFLLLVGLFFAAGVFYFYYTEFSRLIDERLAERPAQASAIYSRPLEIRRGQDLTPDDLARKLSFLGYKSGAELEQGEWYLRRENRFLVGQQVGGRPQRIAIGFNQAGRVVALQSDGQVVDRLLLKGQFLSNLFGSAREKRRRVGYQELPVSLVDAVLAAEDRDFFHHWGIDLPGILRAAWVNLMRREVAQGGSTLTQQFVKNFFLTPERSIRRKLEEMFMAVLVENRFSKRQIFEMYANEIYLGQVGSFGVQGFGQAAVAYFGKDVKELSLAESALLAGIIQAPNRYSPQRHPERAIERRDHVLRLMLDNGLIRPEQMEQALKSRPQVRPAAHQDSSDAPYFVDFLRSQLEERSGLLSGRYQSLEVYSTLDPELQIAAYQAVQRGLETAAKARPGDGDELQAALLALDPRNGDILAMIGGRSYGASQFNRASQALRQPGSTFKPFVYAAALRTAVESSPQEVFTLARMLPDEPYTFVFDGKTYSPRNYGNHYRGQVSLRNALALSLNVPTVRLAEQVGFGEVAESARRLGIERPLEAYPSIALGTFELTLLDLAQGYAVFANQGRLVAMRSIRRVERDGAPLDSAEAQPRQVLDPQVAFLINSALGSVLSYGTGKSVRRRGFDLPAAGKTGSTDDAWFVGYTPDLLCAVWVGFDDSRPLEMSGTRAALPIWTDFMKQARRLGHLSGQGFPRPPSVVALEIDRQTGRRASAQCRDTYTEYFIAGSEPLRLCLQHSLEVAR
ncbi:MAG TPA: PBP1A family penicillin-binding protein [Acidobacteriota bacterium]|nr:PBP1A family penicillin-binding protein [Acidobacteriota bacterium]